MRTAASVWLIVLAFASASCTKSGPKSGPPPVDDLKPAAIVPGRTAVPAHVDPAKESGPARATQIALGDNHACARMSDDTLRCWGGNDWGQLGIGDVNQTNRVVTPLVTGVVEVAAGYGFTCARLRDLTVSCFGNALDGEIGVPSPSNPDENHSIASPTLVPGVNGAVGIGSGMKHSCVVRVDGTVSCWGDNTYGLLGDGTTKSPRSGAVQVKGLDGVTQIGVGDVVCARRVDGTAWCWGSNTTATAQPVAGLSNVVEAAGAPLGACVRDDAGGVKCWGPNDSGQLGRDAHDLAAEDKPAPVKGLVGVTSIAITQTHACAIAGKELVCWGADWISPSFPAACLKNTAHTGGGGGSPAQWKYCAAPTPVAGIPEPIATDVSPNQACALTRAGEVWCWSPHNKPARIAL